VDDIEGGTIMAEHGSGAGAGAHSSARTTVKVHLKDNVDLKTLGGIISGIGGRYGCRTCGLMGVDLELSGDPGDLSDITNLPGVK
jgi:hypothetical protein